MLFFTSKRDFDRVAPDGGMDISILDENLGPVTCTFLLQMIETKSTGKGRQPSGEKETQETAVEETFVQQSYTVNPSTKAKEVGIARTFETKHPQD
jgi:hypothetical protein